MIPGRAFDLAVSYDESAQALKVRIAVPDDEQLGRAPAAGTRQAPRPRPPERADGPRHQSARGPAPRRAGGAGASRVRGDAERWVTKRQLAEHLGVTPRWIEHQQRLGLPRLRLGGMNRYRVSEVEAWLRGRHAAEHGEGR